ncbi:DUF2516 family protein [Nocardioides sp. SYSU DS0663]|uniref:DUF2516 family protein n=1 Tax=Nocardioides sp. SYSU DS0663 TaxID=3416445 RepID=UPI003F4C2C2F
MQSVFAVESYVMLLVFFVLLAVKIFAFVNSLLFPAEAYEAAGKLSKAAWCTILGLGLLLQLPFLGISILLLNLAFTVAAFVYLADVRPALTSLRRR